MVIYYHFNSNPIIIMQIYFVTKQQQDLTTLDMMVLFMSTPVWGIGIGFNSSPTSIYGNKLGQHWFK